MEFTLEPHHKQLRESLRRYFAVNAPTRVVAQCDAEGRYPDEIVSGLADLGIWGMTIADEYGGTAADAISIAIACEEMQRAGGCIASAITPTMTFCAPGLQRHGSEDLKHRLLPQLARGQVRMAIGLSEPDAGSDLSRIAMKARADGDGFIVSGTKVWCTGAEAADYIFALVRTDPSASRYDGFSILLLPTDNPRVTTRRIHKLAAQGTASCEVFVDDLLVPAANLVGELNGGGKAVLSLLDSERVFAAAQSVGIAQGALDLAINYAHQRIQFGVPIIRHQAIAHLLADMAADVAMARLMAYHAAWKSDSGGSYTQEAALAKLACSQLATAVVNRGMQVLGSYSYSVEYPMERYFRESKLFEIAGGTSQILRNVIAKRLIPTEVD